MASRQDLAMGKGKGRPNQTSIVKVAEKASAPTIASNTKIPTLVLPPARRMCAILLFFIGSFSIGFGAGFGTGYASKMCE